MSLSECVQAFVETGRFVAHPWYCDTNGHLNTRYFQGFFDDATQHLLAICGHEARSPARLAVVDVRCAMNYRAEVVPGTLVVVRSSYAALGMKSFTSVHEMRSSDGAILFATCETVSVFFDLDARASVEMNDDFRAKAGRLMPPASAPTL